MLYAGFSHGALLDYEDGDKMLLRNSSGVSFVAVFLLDDVCNIK
jgi:hypothetical protein